MRPKVFTIGGATFDIFVKTQDQAVMSLRSPHSAQKWLCLPHGGKIRIDEVMETFGGGASNTAVGFSRMGFQSAFVGKVGSVYGERVLRNMQEEGVDLQYAKTTQRDKTGFSTIISIFDGDRTVMNYSGANRLFGVKDLPEEALGRADWIFLNHLTGLDDQVPTLLLRLLKKNPKVRLAWNPGREQLEQGARRWKDLLGRTELLFVNKEEAALFAKIPYELPSLEGHSPQGLFKGFLPPYASDVSRIMRELLRQGAKYVAITDGPNGAQASDGKRIFFCPVVSRKRLDTLGAGDAFASGFTSAMILGKSLKEALVYGTLNANGVVNQYGAQKGLLNAEDMRKGLARSLLKVSSASFPS